MPRLNIHIFISFYNGSFLCLMFQAQRHFFHSGYHSFYRYCLCQKKMLIVSLYFRVWFNDLYFMILVEVFTNHISAENLYFTNHIEWIEHKIMGFKPANRYEIIRQSLLSTISIIIHFLWSKSYVNIFYGA